MAKIIFVCENCKSDNEIDVVALASYGFNLQCPDCKREYSYKPMANIHDLAREYLAKDGLKIRDAQKTGVFLFADWLFAKLSIPTREAKSK